MIRLSFPTALPFVLIACAQPGLSFQEAPLAEPTVEVAPANQERGEQETPVQVEAEDGAESGESESADSGPKILAPLPDGVAARGGDVEITFEELDTLLVERHGLRPEGVDILNRLLQREVLQELAAAVNLEIPAQAVNERMADLDKQLKEIGEGGLAQQLAKNDINPDSFQEMLRISMIQAELTRQAMGFAEDKQPTAAQQEAWWKETLTERGVKDYTDKLPTEDDGIVAESGASKVTLGAFKERLHFEIGTKFVEQACTQLLFNKVLTAQAGEIDPGEWTAAVNKEILRRRENHALDPNFAGTNISYESKLEAQGLTVAKMAEDTSVRVTALTTVLARREGLESAPEDLPAEASHDERIRAGFGAIYAAEQEFFDGYFGVRLPLRVCMLRAVEVPNELVTRSIEHVMTYMTKLIPGITSEEKFVELVRKLSEEVNTQKVDGMLGVYGRGDERMPAGMRTTAWEFFDRTGAPGVAGPIQVAGGVALIWVGEAVPAPNHDGILEIVESELQRRILNGAVPETGIHIFRSKAGAQ